MSLVEANQRRTPPTPWSTASSVGGEEFIAINPTRKGDTMAPMVWWPLMMPI